MSGRAVAVAAMYPTSAVWMIAAWAAIILMR